MKIAVAQGDPARGVWGDAFVYTGTPGQTVTVSCYTNGRKAELKLNGVSLGEKTLSPEDGCRVTWQFPYEPGELTAETEGAEDCLCTPGKAEQIVLAPDVSVLPAGAGAVAQIEVSLTDAAGDTAGADDREVYYQLLGDGEILGIENGRGDDLTPYAARYRRTCRGRAILYLRAGTLPGTLTLYAYTKDGLSAACELQVTDDA
jgi:beta-galactosidase